MWKDRGPGVKILWLWTIGTAAVLVTSVVRTRLHDMGPQFSNDPQRKPQNPEATADDNPPDGVAAGRDV